MAFGIADPWAAATTRSKAAGGQLIDRKIGDTNIWKWDFKMELA
jgi:hypothetical protein